jgi:hypothetical protein
MKTWGPASTPGVECATLRIKVSNRREGAERKNPRNVADTGNGGDRRCCQGNGRGNLVHGWFGSPQNPFSNDLSYAQVIESKGQQEFGRRGWKRTMSILAPHLEPAVAHGQGRKHQQVEHR